MQDAPRILGREAFAKRAHAERLRTISNLHDMVISLWRTEGRFIVSGGKDLSAWVSEERNDLVDSETGIHFLVLQAVQAPGLSDIELTQVARDDTISRLLASAEMTKRFTVTQIRSFAEARVSVDKVPEARRRAAALPLSLVLDDAERAWRAAGMPDHEVSDARRRMSEMLTDKS